MLSIRVDTSILHIGVPPVCGAAQCYKRLSDPFLCFAGANGDTQVSKLIDKLPDLSVCLPKWVPLKSLGFRVVGSGLRVWVCGLWVVGFGFWVVSLGQKFLSEYPQMRM